MSFEALNTLTASHVPYKYEFVAATGDERIARLAGCEVYGHDAIRMPVKVLKQLATLDVP